MWKMFEIYSIKNIFLVRKGRAFYAILYQEVFFSIEGGEGPFKVQELPHSEIKQPKDKSALSENLSVTMTAKSPHNSSPRGTIIPKNEAGSFKQTREILRRISSSSSPPQKNTVDFHHGHTVHSKKVTGTIFFLNSEINGRNGMEPRLIQMITLPSYHYDQIGRASW